MDTPKLTVQFSRIRNVNKPTRGTEDSAGMDLYVPDDFAPVWLGPHQAVCIASGLRVSFPKDHALIAFNKSGISRNKNLIIGASVVDHDYTGEVHLHVFNNGEINQFIGPGMKLIQVILLPVPRSEWVEVEDSVIHQVTTLRGDGAFGSTGTY